MQINKLFSILFLFLYFPIFSSEIKEIYVLEYGKSYYPSNLVNTLQKSKSVSMSWLFYLLVDSENHKILADTGFADTEYSKRFGLSYFQNPAKVLESAGFQTSEIDSIIITHSHFDHLGGILLFPNASIYIQKSEYENFSKSSDYSKYSNRFQKAKKENKLFLLEDSLNLYNSIWIQKTGGHTIGSQIIRFQKKGISYVITGDECYFVDACIQKISIPSAAAYSVKNNFKFLNSIQLTEKILTLHDPIHIAPANNLHYYKFTN
jgi:glyoxylase-like metal-dependent hydrolase (beta-lactamase superfamily II)